MKTIKLTNLSIAFLTACMGLCASDNQKRVPIDQIERSVVAVCPKCGKTYIKDSFHICDPKD